MSLFHCKSCDSKLTRFRAYYLCAAIALTVAGPKPARAGLDDLLRAVRPYADLSVTSDDNLFRLPDEALDDNQGTLYTSLGAGFDTNSPGQSRPFRIRGTVFRRSYQDYSEIDYTGGDFDVRWNWLRGRAWTSEVGYDYQRSLRDFANQLVPRVDVRDRNRVRGSIGRRLTQRWRFDALANYMELDPDDELAPSLDRVRSELSVTYTSRQENSIGMFVQASDTNYSVIDPVRDYQERTFGSTFEFGRNDRISLDGSIGHQLREYARDDRLDYDGIAARVRVDWRATPDTRLRSIAWREPTTLADEIANYVIETGISLEPEWQIHARVTLGLYLAAIDREFRNDPELPIDRERSDELHTVLFELAWEANNNTLLELSFGKDERQSTLASQQYDATTARLGVRVGFL